MDTDADAWEDQEGGRNTHRSEDRWNLRWNVDDVG